MRKPKQALSLALGPLSVALGCGSDSSGPGVIPKNATLVFDVELLGVG